jgi:Family of unknown function (DUF6113)
MGMMSGGTTTSRGYSFAVYAVIFVLGVVQGVIGSFHYSQPPVPLIAILLVVGIFATCVLCGWGTMTFSGALAPAAGWLLASFYLSMGTHQGSVIITNTTAGKWYLYGGALAVVASLLASFALLLRARVPPPSSSRPR